MFSGGIERDQWNEQSGWIRNLVSVKIPNLDFNSPLW